MGVCLIRASSRDVEFRFDLLLKEEEDKLGITFENWAALPARGGAFSGGFLGTLFIRVIRRTARYSAEQQCPLTSNKHGDLVEEYTRLAWEARKRRNSWKKGNLDSTFV